MQQHEIEGVLAGKAMPKDIKTGESLARYFARKWQEESAPETAINNLSTRIFAQNAAVGWWDEAATIPEQFLPHLIASKICLMHSELSEALEGMRKNLMDDHLPERQMIEVELADTIIRILDTAAFLKLDVGGAVVEKLAYNAQRADHKRENRDRVNGKKI